MALKTALGPAKTTVRMPAALLEKLQKRSRSEGRSVNEAAVRAIQKYVGEAVDDGDWWRSLGDLVEAPPVGKIDADFHREMQARWDAYPQAVKEGLRGIQEDLDWAREDRS